jgi:hypothetical protein
MMKRLQVRYVKIPQPQLHHCHQHLPLNINKQNGMTPSIEVQLARAKAQLSHLQNQDGSPHDATRRLYQRARIANEQLERIEIGRSLLPLLSKLDDSRSNDNGNDSIVEQIVNATCTATHLATVLSNAAEDATEECSSNNWQAVQDWYVNLHTSTRQSALFLFRKWIRQSAFPEEEGCAILQRVLAVNDDRVEQHEEDSNGHELMNEQQIQDWRRVSACLIELQVVHDALMTSKKQQQKNPPSNWRLDMLDEICRPIADRLRYHFLEETAILNQGNNNSAVPGAGSNRNTMDRFPEWLLRYLKEISEKVLTVVNEMKALMDQVVESALLRWNELQHDQDLTQSSLQHAILTIMPQWNPTAYFLREIVRMARHALRSKSYFSHPDVVGRDARHGVAKRAIEQLFLFDDYIQDRLLDSDAKDDEGLEVPRLVDVFVAANEGLFHWWIEEERYGAVVTLRKCADATLASFQKTKGEDEKAANATGKKMILQPKVQTALFPPIAELFISLVHSSRIKWNLFSSLQSQQHYISNVLGSISSDFLDMIHAEATLLRKLLLSSSKSSSIPSDQDLKINAMGWIGLANGVHTASAMIQSCNHLQQSQILDRIATSLDTMRDAIVEDFTTIFIETIVMERAKFASYTMRCPFLLSQSTFDDHRRGQREGSLVSNLHLSMNLNDSYHVLSVIVQACRDSLTTVEDMIANQQSNDVSIAIEAVSTSQMLSYGARAIMKALGTSISQKLLDIAIDPQGMTPEIQLAGARQFRFDATSIASLFSVSSESNGTGPLERVAAASHLMSLSATKLQQLKDTLFELSSSHNRSVFGDGADVMARRLEVESFYSDERLVIEAESMLAVKGFYALALEEALSIINRRV